MVNKKDKEIPERGDVVLVNYTPQSGTEMKGEHYALVLSHSKYNITTNCIIACPITSNGDFHSIWIKIPDKQIVHGFIIPDQIKHLDWKTRGITIKGKLSTELITKTLDYVKVIIDD